MKGLTKRIVALVCVAAMLGGIVFQGNFGMESSAADTSSVSEAVENGAIREWWMYGNEEGEEGLVVADTTNGITTNKITDANVNLPKGLIYANLKLQVKLTVEASDASLITTLNSSGDAWFEISNEKEDCAELSWNYKNFQAGENNITFAFKNAERTNNTAVNGTTVGGDLSPFDWEETIDFFRFHQQISTTGLKITVSEIKIVYAEAGLEFGGDDTYLKLDSAMDATPNAVEATVNMSKMDQSVVAKLHTGTSFSFVTEGITLGSYTTTAEDTPGAGMECFVLDARNGAISGYEIAQKDLNIDAKTGIDGKLAIRFWVYASESGQLDHGGDAHMRFGSDQDAMGNFMYCSISSTNTVSVNRGWNLIELPLDTKFTSIGEGVDLSHIEWWNICCSTALNQGSYRYYGDIELVVLGDEETEESSEATEWTVISGSDIAGNAGTGTTVATDLPGEGVNYTILNGAGTFETGQMSVNINAGTNRSNLAVELWVWSNEEEEVNFATGDCQLRLSSHPDGVGLNFLYYPMQTIRINHGWNHIYLPLDKVWGEVDSAGLIDLSSIKKARIYGLTLSEGQQRYISDIKLVMTRDTSWTLCDENTSYNNNYGQTYVQGTIGEGSEPPVGTKYAKVEVPAYSSSNSDSGKFGLEYANLPAFDASSEPDNYAICFWLYSSTGQIPGDWIEANSVGTYDGENRLLWNPQQLGIKAGWNYVQLSIGNPTQTLGTVDLSNLQYIRWYTADAPISQDTVLAMTDIEFVNVNSGTVVQTIRPVEEQSYWYGLTKTEEIMQQGPSVGTTYMQTTVPGYTGAEAPYKSCFGFYTGFDAINTTAYAPSNLMVSFWLYTSNGKLPVGQIEINSSGTVNDSAELHWSPESFNSNLKIGWNKISFLLSSGGTGAVDYSSLNFMRWYTDENPVNVVQTDTVFRISEITISAINYKEGNIEVTPNATGVSDSYTIFSNANAVGEENTFSLSVTKDGYPAVLYGNTLFTLKRNVCTGNDVTIKVTRNSRGLINFYIDGTLVATSQTKVTELGAPTNPYSIGADGTGGQVFSGKIKDVKAYSDAAATTCIGYWPLIGNKLYVAETMKDISGNDNHANFMGSRGDDWYEMSAPGENEWSMVYVPDVLGRMYAREHFVWHKMANWIGDNVATEKIQYVVGDKTADPEQATNINYPYGFFDNKVPTGNMNNMGNEEGHGYYRFQAGDGVKWMVITMNVYNGETEYTWAKDVMAKYPYDNVIITSDVYTSAIPAMGEQVKLVISGGIAEGDSVASGVPAMILPEQRDLENTYFNGEQGIGLLYMLRFTNGGTKVTARAFAPMYGKYFDGVDSISYSISSVADPETYEKVYDSATGGTAPTDVPAGYKFAGWYQQYVEEVSGKTYAIYDAKEEAQTFSTENVGLDIDASAYDLENLAVEFWLYSNEDGFFSMGDNHLRISSNKNDGIGANFLFSPIQTIEVRTGWQKITIKLSDMSGPHGGDFNKGSIQRFGFTPMQLPKGSYRYLTDMELVVLDNPSVRWMLRSASETTTKSGQTLETGVADGFGVPVGYGTTASNVYAKYVDADMLGVKAQVIKGTTDRSNYSDIRFVTSSDNLFYRRMGFEITFGGATATVESKYVYTKLYAVGEELTTNDDGTPKFLDYEPSELFSADSRYFKVYSLWNVPNRSFNENFTVRPYWVTMDGTKVYGEAEDKSIWMGYPTNGEYLPKVVKTTYETEDVVIAEIIPTEEKYGYSIDKTGEVDCSAELQRALNDCHNMGGGTVYLPAGTYKISDSITIPSYVTLRGDWQDPDVGTKYGTIFKVHPKQQLDVDRNNDDAHRGTAAFELNGSSGVNGITVFYPDQSVSSVKKYPYTFYVADDASQLITLKNITVLNGYRGIGTSYKVQHEALIVDTFKGTFLDCGMALYNASDAGRVTGVSISSSYWDKCSLGKVDASTYVKANSVGMEIGDLEWQQFSNCSVDGYNIGINVVGGYRINFAGSMVDMNITDCTTGITIAEGNAAPYDAGPDVSGKDKYPLNRGMDPRWGTVIARSTIDGNIVNNTIPKKTTVSLINYKISQTSALLRMTDVSYNEQKVSAQDYSGDWGSFDKNIKSSSEDLGDNSNAKYDASYVKPATNLWVVDLQAYDCANADVSAVIKASMDEFVTFNTEKGYDGGILYIPGGTYRLDNPIEIPAGIELRGVSASANREQYSDCEGTLFMCYYGDDATSKASEQALITLAGDGAGVNGIRFIYPENIITYNTDLNSTYVIRAEGKANVHVTNCYMITSSYGVNFADCDNFYIEGVYGCVYKNMFNVSGNNGIIRGCLSNPNMIVRTAAKGLTENWPTEAAYNNTSATINQIRNSLKDELNYITVTGGNVLIQDVTAYAVNTMVSNTEATTVVINSNADCMDDGTGAHFNVTSGNLTAINALRAAVTDVGESETAERYAHTGGTLHIYNSLMAKADEDASAFEENYSLTK